jgi:diaminohydroxyphosphoribosylaminopyrimidine deaminase/5-amino-6-(5-phosphoribosylamino)uracil reductase
MNDAIFMERCLELAKKGLGNTYPNPLVGSVIVHEGKVIGEGWHKKAGCNHAEREAISKVKDPSLLLQQHIICEFGTLRSFW